MSSKKEPIFKEFYQIEERINQNVFSPVYINSNYGGDETTGNYFNDYPAAFRELKKLKVYGEYRIQKYFFINKN